MKKQDISENLAKLVYLAIGSNLGNKINNIEITKLELERYKIKILKSSSNYLSKSWPDPTKPNYINVVIKVETNLEFWSPFFFVVTSATFKSSFGEVSRRSDS